MTAAGRVTPRFKLVVGYRMSNFDLAMHVKKNCRLYASIRSRHGRFNGLESLPPLSRLTYSGNTVDCISPPHSTFMMGSYGCMPP